MDSWITVSSKVGKQYPGVRVENKRENDTLCYLLKINRP